MRDITKHIFTGEGNSFQTELSKRTNFTPIVGLHIKVLTNSLAIVEQKDLEKSKEIVSSIIKDTIALYRDSGIADNVHRDLSSILHLMITRFTALCWEEAAVKKMAGYYGLAIFIDNSELGGQWIQDRQIDIIKSLIAILKDAPPDTIKNIPDVTAALHSVLRICYTRANASSDMADSSAVVSPTHANPSNILIALRMLVQEFPGPNSLLRATVRQGVAILADLTGQTIVDMITPFRDGLVNPIYSKPLRALPLQRQIGHVDTITYALSLRPPLLVVNDELWRMLNEALAVADTSDENIAPAVQRGGPPQRHTRELVTKLRISCLKLLTSATHLTEFFSGQANIRQRSACFYVAWCPKLIPRIGLSLCTSNPCIGPPTRSKMLLQRGFEPHYIIRLAYPKICCTVA